MKQKKPLRVGAVLHVLWWPVRMLGVAIVAFYRCAVRPHFCGQCRFTPHCSAYALAVLRNQPTKKAMWLVVKRLAACHPFSKRPTIDLPPVSGDMS
jgi:putative membrane protein insertion efficiency factor